jgi:uncharacterized delta-60 repeat protein
MTVAVLAAMWRICFVAFAACGSVSGMQPPGGDDDGGAATLALSAASSWVPQQGSVSIPFTIARTTATGALTVHVDGLPAGVTADDVELDAATSDGELVIAATTSAVLGATTPVMVELEAGTTALDTKSFAVMVSGAPGTVDTTWGDGGHRVLALPDPVVGLGTGNAAARAIAQYPATAGADAGKIVVAADLITSGTTSTSTKRIAIARFDVDGTADASFGGGTGYVLLDPGDAVQLEPAAVAIDSQGRIVVASLRFDSAAQCFNNVMRVTAAGVKDPAFTTYDENPPGGFCGRTEGMTILAGDKIEVVGFWNNPDTSQLPILIQLNADGSRDTTAFDGTYVRRMPNPDTTKPVLAPYQLVVDHHGNFVMPGFRCDGSFNSNNNYTSCESLVARITPAGAWDVTFGPTQLGYSSLVFGTTPVPNVSVQAFYGVAIDGSDHIVAAGWTENATDGAVARFDDTGALDTSFAGTGRITPALVTGASSQSLSDLVVDSAGRLVLVGNASNGGALLITTRVSATGVVDQSYGDHGVSAVPTLGVTPRAVLQADGRLVASGAFARAGGGYDLAVWRFWP